MHFIGAAIYNQVIPKHIDITTMLSDNSVALSSFGKCCMWCSHNQSKAETLVRNCLPKRLLELPNMSQSCSVPTSCCVD